MSLISIEGMRFRGFHGVYEEEGALGNDFVIDVFIETDIGGASESDELSHTINYETIHLICKAEMGKPVKLLETLINNIIDALKFQFATIEEVKIKVKKLNPIPGGEVAFAAIEQEEEFATSCPRCKKPVICYGDGTCWCQSGIKVPAQTLQNLKTQYRGCLCKSCLLHFAG